MKSLPHKLFLLLFSVLLLASCKSDDSEQATGGDTVSENKKPLGTSAEDILSDDIYQSITVEFAYADGFRPKQETIDAFRDLLNARIHKPGGIGFVETVIPPPTGAPFNSTEIRAIEDANRTQFTNGDHMAVYVFFANGSSTNDTQVSFTLGSAYQNTSMVVYEKTLRDIVLATPGANLEILETTTLQHEFGHILGLTNILGDDIHVEHEDQFHNKHCFVEDCLMFFDASNSTRSSIERMSRRPNVPVFDPLCIEDLQAKGGK